MTSYLCETCGTWFPPSGQPPSLCPICRDERQYVGLGGQTWTTHEQFCREHRNEWFELEPGLAALRTQPSFAIGQRALLLETPSGNILWDCIALLDDATIRGIRERGGLSAIAVSHPHYYTAMAYWSEAFASIPVYLHAADREHAVFPPRNAVFWTGEELELHDGIRLIRCGGHFEGGTVLHWPDGAEGRGALLSGDIIQVVPDRRWVSFMYSYPNLIPLNAPSVRRIAAAVEPYPFERIYGAFHPMQVMEDGKGAMRRSVERYLRAVTG